MYSDESFRTFVGQKIEEVWVQKNEKENMYWKVNGAWHHVVAVGDCCSHSWFAHCDNGEALQNATLTEFQDVGGGDISEDDYDCIQVNMLKFTTNKGFCTIEFRNSSNGYYSGWCEFHVPSDGFLETLLTDYEKLGDF